MSSATTSSVKEELAASHVDHGLWRVTAVGTRDRPEAERELGMRAARAIEVAAKEAGRVVCALDHDDIEGGKIGRGVRAPQRVVGYLPRVARKMSKLPWGLMSWRSLMK